MPLRVVTGRANAGKTGWILTWALEALEAGVSPTLIVPNLADVRRMQVELARKAPLGIRVSTAESFTEELWQLHGDGRRIAGDATRSAVMRQILADQPDRELTASARTAGFERLMVRSAQWSSPFLVRDEGETAAGTLVLDVLQRYREALTELGLIEHSWVGALMGEEAPEIGFLGALRFTTYSSGQIALLLALSTRNSVVVALNWEDGFAPTAANDAAANALLPRAEVVKHASESQDSSEIGLLAGRLYGGDGPLEATGEVVLGQAHGREAEAALVANLAGAAIREGVPAERVAVVFPQLAPRASLVRNALAAEGLEGDFDFSLSVAATAFGRALSALLAIALGTGGRAEALQYLYGPFSDADAETVFDMDRGWRKHRHGEDSRRILENLCAIGGVTREVARLCREVARGPVDEVSAMNWQKVADHLISTAAVDDAGVSSEDAGAHRALTRAIAEMASAPGHPFTAGDVLDALPTLACTASLDESTGRVQVIQASRVGSRRFDVVIVGGLTQAETPGMTRETFASEVGAIVSGSTRAVEESVASLEFYTLITRARRRLALVRQTANSDGAAQVASPLLDEVLEVYRDSAPEQDEDGSLCPLHIVRCDDIVSFAPVFTQGRRDVRMLSEDRFPSVRVVVHGAVDSALATAAVSERVFSATEIETYLECPYRWFYSRILRPTDIDVELDAAALGSRAHRLIADFYEALRGEGVDRVMPATLPGALELFERSVVRSERAMASPLSLGEEIDVGRARMWARHVVEDDADLFPDHVPHGHEVIFGRESAFEFAGVPVAGVIDRLDVGPDGAVVTDYKSTRDVGKLAKIGTGLGIQHVLYAAASEKLLGQPVQGSVYRSLRTRQMRGFWRAELLPSVPRGACDNDIVDEAGYAELVSLVEEQVAGVVDGIKAGKVPRAPRTPAACRYCTLSAICEGARS